ncbi:hypothetical protein B0T25DRAFT_332732 [Lasiosphaeria hispida]|uniref:Uncharacterized protein n=1 Tax=Lasiosphaeria hispida TaxID=260671 RepID=A0AAJ0H692_9PEZI|nr:hypothetical protein B0T25DRAFT_332732 [Lasiosphaeria hispida]
MRGEDGAWRMKCVGTSKKRGGVPYLGFERSRLPRSFVKGGRSMHHDADDKAEVLPNEREEEGRARSSATLPLSTPSDRGVYCRPSSPLLCFWFVHSHPTTRGASGKFKEMHGPRTGNKAPTESSRSILVPENLGHVAYYTKLFCLRRFFPLGAPFLLWIFVFKEQHRCVGDSECVVMANDLSGGGRQHIHGANDELAME